MTSLTLVQRLGITPEDRKLRFDWTTLTERDSQLIRDAARYVAPAADDIVRKFYDHSMKFEGFTSPEALRASIDRAISASTSPPPAARSGT